MEPPSEVESKPAAPEVVFNTDVAEVLEAVTDTLREMLLNGMSRDADLHKYVTQYEDVIKQELPLVSIVVEFSKKVGIADIAKKYAVPPLVVHRCIDIALCLVFAMRDSFAELCGTLVGCLPAIPDNRSDGPIVIDSAELTPEQLAKLTT